VETQTLAVDDLFSSFVYEFLLVGSLGPRDVGEQGEFHA
jgi:hypothetical protein